MQGNGGVPFPSDHETLPRTLLASVAEYLCLVLFQSAHMLILQQKRQNILVHQVIRGY